MKALTVAVLVASACIASAAAGWTARGLSFQNRPQLVATPRIIEKCEKEVADVVINGDSDNLSEGAKRYYAISTQRCYEYGLVSDSEIETVRRSKIGPYLEQYRSNPDVWRKS